VQSITWASSGWQGVQRRSKDEGRGDESCQSTERMQANSDDKRPGENVNGEAPRRFPHFPCCFCLKCFFPASPQFFPSQHPPFFLAVQTRPPFEMCFQGCRLLLSQSVAITSVKWRQKDDYDDGQRQHATRCCNLKTNSRPLCVCVWKK